MHHTNLLLVLYSSLCFVCVGALVPLGKSPKPLGSIRIRENEKVGLDEKQGGIYGGVGDKPHLGGWTTYDEQGVSNHTWNYMMGIIGVKSVLDIGCGRGISSSYFYENGARVKCIEGSIDAIDHTFLPKQENQELIINHDFTRGPYWPDETFDACWSIEVLEHLSRQYVKNYMPSFRRCALIFVSASVWGGHHHVEVHAQWWWKARFAAYGMQYLRDVTRDIHQVTMWEKHYLKRLWDAKSVHDHRVGTYGQHLTHGLMVFINPEVASLPEHDHLFSGDGCYDAKWVLVTHLVENHVFQKKIYFLRDIYPCYVVHEQRKMQRYLGSNMISCGGNVKNNPNKITKECQCHK